MCILIMELHSLIFSISIFCVPLSPDKVIEGKKSPLEIFISCFDAFKFAL